MILIPRDQLVEIVREDLRYIQSEWNESIDDASLRRGSATLRRLLVQNELQRAWKAAGFEKEPKITASSLTPILKRFPKGKIIFAAAGGARYQGMELRGALELNYAINQTEASSMSAEGVPQEILGLKDFIESPCLVLKGLLVPRRVLIKFVANKLGGAHFDPSRSGTAEEQQLLRLLDRSMEQYKLLGKNVVYFELLGVGQAIGRAEDILRLCNTQ